MRLYDQRFYQLDNVIFARFESNTKKDYEMGCDVDISLFVLIEKIDNILTSGVCVDKNTDDIIQTLNLILIRQNG